MERADLRGANVGGEAFVEPCPKKTMQANEKEGAPQDTTHRSLQTTPKATEAATEQTSAFALQKERSSGFDGPRKEEFLVRQRQQLG